MESLDVKLKVLGPQHSDVANTIENIGVIFAQQGKHDLALDKFAEALGVCFFFSINRVELVYYGFRVSGLGWVRRVSLRACDCVRCDDVA